MEDKNQKKRHSYQEAIPKIEHYCTYQERCQKEVMKKLYDLGLDEEDRMNAMQHLIKKGFLNEERFAIAFAGGKFRQKSWGKTKIVNELKARGISEYCIKKALKEIEPDDYKISLLNLAEKYAQNIKGGKVYEKKTKTIRYLLGKGYEYDQCQYIVAEMNWE
jgi:regulatory protein